MQVDFSTDGSAATPVEVIPPPPISPSATGGTVTGTVTTAPAPAPAPASTAVAVVAPSPGVPAERKLTLSDKLPSFKDVILPRLNIVHNTGNLKDTFTPGSLVFAQNTVLHVPGQVDPKTGNALRAPTPPIKIIVVGIISDRFAEKIQGGIGGLIVNTEEEVRSAGGTLDYGEWKLKKDSGIKRFEPLTDLLLLIERPELVADNGAVFNFSVTGKKYALAAWAVKGGAYTRVMKRCLNYHRLAGILTGGFPTWSFFLGTTLEKFEVASAWMPVIQPAEKTSDEMMKFVYNVAGTPV